MNIGIEEGAGLPDDGGATDGDPYYKRYGDYAVDEINGPDRCASEDYGSGAFGNGAVVVNVAVIIDDENVDTHQSDSYGERNGQLPEEIGRAGG